MSRNIDGDIWQDDWFGMLEPVGKIIWIGLIHAGADDQGRFLDNAELMKSKLFPYNSRIDANEIDIWITWFVTDGKIHRYKSGGKALAQIVNWWKYQSGSAWMGASKYPAPEGWTDRARYHGKGNVPISENWDKPGGFSTTQPTTPPTYTPTTQPTSGVACDEVKVNVNGEVKGDGDDKGNSGASSASLYSEFMQNAGYKLSASRVLCDAAQLPAIPSTGDKYIETVSSMLTAYGEESTRKALETARAKWTSTQRKDKTGYYSVLNFAWVDWAMAELSGNAPKEVKKAEYNPFASLEMYMEGK